MLDKDGMLYHGNCLVPYAQTFIHTIQHIPHIFMTTNPILLPEDIAQKLAKLGLPKPSFENILTSGIATAEY